MLHCERLKNAVFFDPLRYPNKLDLSIGNVFIHRGGHPNEYNPAGSARAGRRCALVKKPTQNHNLMRLPFFRGIAEVRASLPGRMRLYLPTVSANREAAEEMKRQLEATGVVHEVALNFRLSTALIRYDETKVEAAVVQGAVLKLMGLTDGLQKEPVSRIQSGLNTLMAAINHGLLEATNGLLDVRTLAGCALTFAGVKSLAVSGAAVPGAMTLLWWAASIWRRNDSGTN